MERIGRYQVESELGRGSMSIVYKAFDPRIDRPLAVKVLREKYARDVSSRQRFLREARAAGGLGHPNIVTVFDVGQIDGVPYLAMELLEGDTLADRLDGRDPPDLRQTLALLVQLTSALSYAHDRGVIHRDIKPANIYFDQSSGVAKLLDFGIAAVSTRPEYPLNESGVVLGTPDFMAPEQISGEPQDERCDLYSLGVVMYRLLSGRLPFDGQNLSEQLANVIQQPPPTLDPIHTETPVELIEMAHRLLAKKPGARYQSAHEVLEELQDIRDGLDQGLLAAARRGGWTWRWPLLVGSLVAVVLFLGLSHVYRSQNEAMALATLGYGEGLASVIAREIAEPLLLDDSAALGNLVADFSGNPQVLYLHVIDRNGLVQSSTNLFFQDEPAPQLERPQVRRDEPTIRVLQAQNGDLEFQVPIRFQARRVGEVYLGLDGSELSVAARSTLGMMTLVFLVAMLVIMVALSLMMRRQRRIIERVGWGLRRVGKGHYEFRLEADRRDEFRHLYRRFNDMAMRLQERHGEQRIGEVIQTSLPSGATDDNQPMDRTQEMVKNEEPQHKGSADKKVARLPRRRNER